MGQTTMKLSFDKRIFVLFFGLGLATVAVLLLKPSRSEARKSVNAETRPQASPAQFKRFKKGDTVYSLLPKYGFTAEHMSQVFNHKLPFKKLTVVPNDLYRARQHSKNHLELKFYAHPTNSVFVVWREGSRAGARFKKEMFEVRTRTVKGKILGPLITSLKAAIDDSWITLRFLDAYTYDYQLTKILKKGAEFSLTFEEKYDDGMLVGYGEVLETHLEIHEGRISRYFVPHAYGGSFIGLESLNHTKSMHSPVGYARISSAFNPRRLHPIKRHRMAHMGIDFELPEGEPVMAVDDGRVLRYGKNRGAGNFVVVSHANGLESYYNHLSALHPALRKGTALRAGQIVGKIGCTGYCTKPHLHFAVKKQGRFVDPIQYLRSYPEVAESVISRKVANLKVRSNSALADL